MPTSFINLGVDKITLYLGIFFKVMLELYRAKVLTRGGAAR
jgi:hypothetical protein